MTVMGESIVNWLSDRGSIPLSSIFCGKEGSMKWEDTLSPLLHI